MARSPAARPRRGSRALARAVLSVLAALAAPSHADEPDDDDPAAAEIRRLRDAALDLAFEREKRVVRVADAVRVGGVDLCGTKVSPVFGLIAAEEEDFPEHLRAAAERRWALDDRVRVLWVRPDAPSAAAGLRAGDVLVRVDGRKVRSASSVESRPAGTIDGPLSVVVEREGRELALEVAYQRGCYSAGHLVLADFVNAWMWQGDLYVTSGMVRLAANDDEIAILVGHEIAHHLLGHHRTFPAYELDADYLGAYLAARAGYDVAAAPPFWRRFALSYPFRLGVDHPYAHPASPVREARLAATLAEISERRARGEPLVPTGLR